MKLRLPTKPNRVEFEIAVDKATNGRAQQLQIEWALMLLESPTIALLHKDLIETAVETEDINTLVHASLLFGIAIGVNLPRKD